MTALAVGSLFAGPAWSAGNWNATLAGIDTLFDSFAADSHAPGLIYAVVRDGRVAHVHAVGVQDLESNTPVTAETVFRLASLTKAFTALAVLRLRDGGRLDLDAPARRFVPELRVTPRLTDLAPSGCAISCITPRAAAGRPVGRRQLDISNPRFHPSCGRQPPRPPAQ
jgi:CubicO group peptidase (beta-lactamase class C family)